MQNKIMNFRSVIVVAICVCVAVCSGEKKKHEFKFRLGHLKEIPKRFEIQDENAEAQFAKYLSDIRDLAKQANMTVRYKVKVELQKPIKKRIKRLEKGHKVKSKKYIVPLKRKNMKLSNLEIIMRKQVDTMASEASVAMHQVPNSTEKVSQLFTTKAMFNGKYKPILRHVKSNYTKIVKPVRNKIITLTYEPIVE